MEEKKYLNLFNKVGYGSGDFAANMVYSMVSSFVMIYLTNTIGMAAGIIGTLILVSKLTRKYTGQSPYKNGKSQPLDAVLLYR